MEAEYTKKEAEDRISKICKELIAMNINYYNDDTKINYLGETAAMIITLKKIANMIEENNKSEKLDSLLEQLNEDIVKSIDKNLKN